MTSEQFLQGCESTLLGFAQKGFFSSLAKTGSTAGNTDFRFRWQFNQLFDIRIQANTGKISMPAALPNVPARSKLDRDFRTFVKSYMSDELPPHRRFKEGQLKVVNRNSNLSVNLSTAPDLEPLELPDELAKLISLIHETYKLFLKSGDYDDYIGTQFGIDMDSFW